MQRQSEPASLQPGQIPDVAVIAHENQLLLVDPRDADHGRVTAIRSRPDGRHISAFPKHAWMRVIEMRIADSLIIGCANRFERNTLALEFTMQPAEMLRNTRCSRHRAAR